MSNIEIEVNGVRYTGFEQISVTKSIDAFCGTFSFQTSSSDLEKFPLKQNDSCKIYVENEIVISGFIERFEVSYDATSDTITVSGRDRTSDVLDGSLGSELKFSPPITLKKVCDKVLSILGITEIKTIQDCKIDKFLANDVLMDGEIGTNVFHFLNTYAKLREVILTTNSNGDLLLTKSSKTLINTVLTSNEDGLGERIKSANLVSDISKRFNKYTFYSTDNLPALVLPGTTPKKPKDVSDNSQQYIDIKIRKTRIFSKKKERSSGNKTTIKNRAEWEGRIREVNGFYYQASVQGFIANNDNTIWKPNMLVHIDDNKSKVVGSYLINSVQYDITMDEGSITTMTFVKKNAYDLKLQLEGSGSDDPPWEL